MHQYTNRVIHKKLCTAFLSCYSFLRLWSRAYKLGINGLIPFLPIFRYADNDPILILLINSQRVCYHPHDPQDRTNQTHFKSLSNVSGKSMSRYVHPERSPFQFVTSICHIMGCCLVFTMFTNRLNKICLCTALSLQITFSLS